MKMLDLPELAIRNFERLTNLRVCVHDLVGRFAPVLDPGRSQHGGPLCLAAKTGPHVQRCWNFEVARFRTQLRQFPEGRIHRCHAGLIECVAPILLRNEPIAVLFAGQMQATRWTPDHIEPRSPIPIPKGTPVVTRERAETCLEALRQLGARLLYWVDHELVPTAPRTREERIHSFIQAHHTGSPTLDLLGRHLSLSPSRTAHVVREATGHSYSELLVNARLQTACYLLQHSDLPIIEVAMRSGFADVSRFHKVFKRRFSSSPQSWREQLSS